MLKSCLSTISQKKYIWDFPDEASALGVFGVYTSAVQEVHGSKPGDSRLIRQASLKLSPLYSHFCTPSFFPARSDSTSHCHRCFQNTAMVMRYSNASLENPLPLPQSSSHLPSGSARCIVAFFSSMHKTVTSDSPQQ